MSAFFQKIWSPQYFTGISATLSVVTSAMCYGWFAPTITQLLDPKNPEHWTQPRLSWTLSTLSFGALIGSFTSGLIADKWGRKTCILITGPMFFFPWIVVLFFKSYKVFLFIRIVQGIAVGTVFTITPVYLGEISSIANRGSITGLISMGWFIGFLVEYCLGAVLSFVPFTLFTSAIPFLFTILFYFQPESPYYLITNKKETKAKATLKYLRRKDLKYDIEIELEDIKKSVNNDLANKCSWMDIVRTPSDRRALFVVCLIGMTRLMSGQIPLMTYSSNLFMTSGFSLLSPKVLTIILGVAIFVGGLVNSFFVDSFGRRPLIIISCVGSMLSLTLVAIYFFLKEKTKIDTSSYGWIVPLGVIANSIFNVIGLFPISMTYSSELFTNKTKRKSLCVVNIVYNTSVFISVKLYQIIDTYFGMYAVFTYFTLIVFLGCILLYIYAPETKGQTFTQIREDLLNVINVKHPQQTVETIINRRM